MKSVSLTPKPIRRSADEVAFLPAALEIVETPASPLAGAVAITIISFFCIAIAWACFGKIDIVSSATGQIMSTGRTKIIQPFETGVVRAIHVQDGQQVKAGEVLIELDPTMNNAERNHLQSDLMSAQLDVARLKALLSSASDPLTEFQAPLNADPSMVAAERDYLIHQLSEQQAKLATLASQKSQKEAELATINATVAKLETVLPVLQQRVDIRKTLFDHETGSKVNYLEIYQSLVEGEQDLKVQKSRSHEAEAAIEAIAQSQKETIAEFRRMRSSELVEAQRKATGLSDDLVKANQRTKLQLLTAPVDGTVQQLSVHTIGGVVTPAQTLLVLAPADSHMEVEAMIPNRDVGFIHVDQDVEIKVDTFNFTRYGLIHGKVISLSHDAISRNRPVDKGTDQNSGSITGSSEPQGQELLYAARISLDRTQMQVDENVVNLSPGMAVTAEIKTGSRPVISYLLSPLIRYKQESLRER